MTSSSTPQSTPGFSRFLDRRNFLRSSVNAGAGMLLVTSKSAIAQQEAGGRTIKCALVGCGAQGETLRISSATVPGIQWVAVADVWKYNRNPVALRMARAENKHQVNGSINQYDTIEELLDKEKELDAVFIATPDFLHAPFSRMALMKGKAVYCEKMMSNTIEGARDMVKAQQETGGIFQIGHQRHSNPRYLHLRDKVIKKHNMLGRITHAYGQWNRGVSQSVPLGMPKGQEIAPEFLAKYGYEDAFQFRNWRFFSKYGGGPIADLGAHQIDMFNWTFESTPVSIIATGGVDYYDGTDGRAKYELPDNVMCIYEYNLSKDATKPQVARAYYQVLTTTSSQGAYEKYMGINGAAVISELDKNGNQVYREASAPAWDEFAEGANPLVIRAPSSVYNKIWEKNKAWPPWNRPEPWLDIRAGVADVRESKGLDPFELPVVLIGRPHSPHIQNFIEAVQMKKYEHLTCPVEMAFKSCVTVLSAYESIKTGAKVVFKPEDFKV